MSQQRQQNISNRCQKHNEKSTVNFLRVKKRLYSWRNCLICNSFQGPVSILDPGAGSGILSTALIERMQRVASITKIELVCYESDTNILELLRSNLDWVCVHATKKIEYKIISDNYILSQVADYNHMLWESPNPPKFDCVIGNPPYMKIPKDAPEALAMPDVCYGAPNLYFLFASMSLFNLKDAGEMVYIIPRSWTSGAYFKNFGRNFLMRELWNISICL